MHKHTDTPAYVHTNKETHTHLDISVRVIDEASV